VLLGTLLAITPTATARKEPVAPAEPSPLRTLIDLPDLYEMAGRSESVVLGTVKEIARYATFHVEEIYAGSFRAPELRVMYRSESWERRLDGIGGFRFRPGERYLLFLKYHREHEKVVSEDLFELMDGDWGRLLISDEGGSVYIEAMRLLMGAASRPNLLEQHAVLVGLLASPNHLAAAAAMNQVYQRRLGSVDSIPTLLAQMDLGIAGLRLGALKILRRMAPALPANLDRGSLAAAVHRRISWDDSDPVAVREEAVRMLAALGPAAEPLLRSISRTDADQQVRYRAAVLALEIKG
jgi:hypothetical protein